ncbi:MAG TPA: DNA-3-methyladenine glycosylase 2 family protein [Candidatus Ozemobacteraceae bacterium]|nr:DNA-3-methyladenine glycosylase 2 family protein [Candidatus Ozemobacteraceae bacterium]
MTNSERTLRVGAARDAIEMTSHAIAEHLRRADQTLAQVISHVGLLKIEPSRLPHPFQTLFHAIVAQQISTRAADTIVRRVHALFPRHRILRPDEILAIPEVQLRLAGLSFKKIAAVKDLADQALSGALPTVKRLLTLTDDEVRTCLTRIRGIGVWTADMFLIFHLQRPNVLPLSDHALKRSVMLAYELPELPSNEELLVISERWRPFRSVACRYLWRYLDSL